MYDMFMVITGIIFIVFTIVNVFLFATAILVNQAAFKRFKYAKDAWMKYKSLSEHYEDAIQRSNETVVEKFRHDLDYHAGENLK